MIKIAGVIMEVKDYETEICGELKEMLRART